MPFHDQEDKVEVRNLSHSHKEVETMKRIVKKWGL